VATVLRIAFWMLSGSVTSVRIPIAPFPASRAVSCADVDIRDRDLGALACEQDCGRTSNSGATSRDQCDLALKPRHWRFLPCACVHDTPARTDAAPRMPDTAFFRRSGNRPCDR
jgi:hypothetical protein